MSASEVDTIKKRDEWSSEDFTAFVNKTIDWEIEHNKTITIDITCTKIADTVSLSTVYKGWV